MNNPTFELIQSYIDSYDDIWKKYNLSQSNITILATDLSTIMPINLKTPAKIKFYKTFGDNVSEVQFIELLQYQTTGADFINFVYLIKYYKLQFDSNGMIIWSTECPYVNFKPEAINNWYIWHTLTTHPMFGKYMSTLLEFKLQNRLETNIFPMNQNLKNDLYFPKQKLVNSTNEKQHNTFAQKELDTISIALHRIHGIRVISFYTTAFVDIEHIKKYICDDLHKNVNNTLNLLSDKIYLTHNITTTNIKKYISTQICMMARDYFKKPHLKEQKDNVKSFNKINDANLIKATIADVLKEYLVIVNETIHNQIKNNQYLKCYTSTLLDTLLSSCLNSVIFSQDYDQVIIAETLIDDMQFITNSMKVTQDITKYELPLEYQDDYNFISELFADLLSISKEFINDPDDYNVMYKLKLKSLKKPNNPYVITIKDIQKLFKMHDINDVKDIKNITTRACGINRFDSNILISWKQLQKILFKFNLDPTLQKILLFQYSMADQMNKNKEDRLKEDTALYVGSCNTFNNYYNRVHKKFNLVLKSLQTHVIGSIKQCKIKVPYTIVLEKIKGFTIVNRPDAVQLMRKDILVRLDDIITEFNTLLNIDTGVKIEQDVSICNYDNNIIQDNNNPAYDDNIIIQDNNRIDSDEEEI